MSNQTLTSLLNFLSATNTNETTKKHIVSDKKKFVSHGSLYKFISSSLDLQIIANDGNDRPKISQSGMTSTDELHNSIFQCNSKWTSLILSFAKDLQECHFLDSAMKSIVQTCTLTK